MRGVRVRYFKRNENPSTGGDPLKPGLYGTPLVKTLAGILHTPYFANRLLTIEKLAVGPLI